MPTPDNKPILQDLQAESFDLTPRALKPGKVSSPLTEEDWKRIEGLIEAQGDRIVRELSLRLLGHNAESFDLTPRPS